MSSRKQANSVASSSTGSPKKKGRGERLIDSGREVGTVGTSFVSGKQEISSGLVAKVSVKACELYMTFTDTANNNQNYYGQGGLIQGEKLAVTPSDGDGNGRTRQPKRRKTNSVTFQEYASYEATPVTAKYNLESCHDERYRRTTVKSPDGLDQDLIMPDGGCTLIDEITVRAATADTLKVTWDAEDVSFGEKVTDTSSSLTKKPRHFVKAPNGFRLRVGQKIGMAVYRTFDITHEDAKAPTNVSLEDVYGKKLQACVYTGIVTEVSENDQTFCHSINAFEGCSGAVVFLLDQNQEVQVEDEFHGMAVGIHVGGLDLNNNIAFLLK